MRRLIFIPQVCFSRPQFWLLSLYPPKFLLLLPKCLLQWPLALELIVEVAFIVITVIEMDISRSVVIGRRGRLSLAEVGVPHRVLVVRLLVVSLRVLVALSILIHKRYLCCFVVLLP
jgi:hypothetical protein